MRSKPIGNVVLISVALLFFTSNAFAVVEHETVRYERPLRAIRGRVTSLGYVMRVVWVDVYDNAQVRVDDSVPFVEQRKRQTKVVSLEPNEKGEFNIKHLPKGFYEVQFGNRGMGGYNILSVLVNVDPKGAKDRLCVDLSLEGGGGPQSSVAKCPEK
jgi:hypothetical protein